MISPTLSKASQDVFAPDGACAKSSTVRACPATASLLAMTIEGRMERRQSYRRHVGSALVRALSLSLCLCPLSIVKVFSIVRKICRYEFYHKASMRCLSPSKGLRPQVNSILMTCHMTPVYSCPTGLTNVTGTM